MRDLWFSSPLRPRCGDGHPLRIDPIATDRLLTCRHREGRVAPPCGAHLYLARVWIMGEPVILGVRTTREHLTALATLELTALERLAYLGLTAPGVDLDLQGAA